MPRYYFKAGDLAPLRKFTQRLDVQRVLQRAVPVKTFSAPPAALEVVPDPMPIRVRTRDNPNGVPLGDVNDLVKQRVPGVRSVTVRDNVVLVTYDQQPTDAMRAQVKAALGDQKSLQAILDKQTAASAQLSDAQLKQKLLASDTSDAEWLQSFRRLQTAQLAGNTTPNPNLTLTPGPTPTPTPGGKT